MPRIRSVITLMQRLGPVGGLRYVALQLSEVWTDRRLGIATRALVPSDGGPDSIDYMPIPYRALRSLLPRASLGPDSVFLDYGSGMGRVAAVAATYPIGRVIGVELSHRLVAQAERNMRRARGLRCRDITFVAADAATFDVPDDVTVIHFYNPFIGRTLERVVNRIGESLTRRPRRLEIVFFNHDHFDRIVARRNWIRRVFTTRFFADLGAGSVTGAVYLAEPDGRHP